MKKVILLLVAILMGMTAMAETYTYLNVKKADGTEVQTTADGLKIVFQNGNLVATTPSGTVTTQALSGLSSMYFTNTQQGGGSELRGDVNGDGVVDVSDVTALVNKILGMADWPDSRCDIDGSGVIDVSDVTVLINIILGLS